MSIASPLPMRGVFALCVAVLLLSSCSDEQGPSPTCSDYIEGNASWDQLPAAERETHPCNLCIHDETGESCDVTNDVEGLCTCTGGPFGEGPPPNNSAATNNTQPDPPAGWRYVLFEDTTSPVAGEFPGVDADAVEIVNAEGTSFFATTVEDFNLGGGSALDTAQILGAPDSNCDANSGAFVSLGGQDAGGYIMVGFSSSGQDVTFGKGSTVTLHELGASMCGLTDDDPYSVSISVSTDRASFTQIGSGTGMTAIPVTIDP